MGGGFITLFKLLPGGQPSPRTHPAPKMLWWSNHSSVMAAQNNILLSLIRLPITHRRFVEIICGDAVVTLQKRRRAANAVTRRSHPRTFVRAADRKGLARLRSATSGCQGLFAGAAEARHVATRWRSILPSVTVACEDSAFASHKRPGAT